MKRLKKGTPGQGGESPRDSFSSVPVGAGLKNSWTGWIAGETYWCQAHEHRPPAALGTKPCLTWMTDGALPCPRCRPSVVPTWIGYVPIYREIDHAPCIVIVHESVMDVVAGLRYGTRVTIGRAAETASAYVRRAESQQPVWSSTHAQRQGPRDITPDLLCMWGIPMLDEWIRCSAPASDSAVSLGSAAVDPSEAHKPDAQPYTAPGDGVDGARLADYPALAARLAGGDVPEPPPNGRLRKK